MKTSLTICMILLIALLASGCGAAETQPAATPDNNLVATIVAATLNAPKPATQTLAVPPTATVPVDTLIPSATSSPTVIATPTAPVGEVKGRICYRTRDIPAMTAFFQEVDDKDTQEMKVAAGQNSYNVDLAPGKYIAFAWLEDYSLGGLYSQAVPCGMKVECTDHAAIQFEVRAGETLEDIDICDWFAFNVPQPPDRPSEDIRGSISGQINHPGGTTPELHVVAYNLDTSYWYYTLTLAGATRFTISELPPGTYQVVAYTRDGSAGGAADAAHALTPIVVKAGESSTANISDWSAPAGTFPQDPTEW